MSGVTHAVVPPWHRGRSYGGSEAAVVACRNTWRAGDRVVLVGNRSDAEAARVLGLRLDAVVSPPLGRARLAARRVERMYPGPVRWWTHPVAVSHTAGTGDPDDRHRQRERLRIGEGERCILALADHPSLIDVRAVNFLISVLAVRTEREVLVVPRGCVNIASARRYAAGIAPVMRLIEVPAPACGWIPAADAVFAAAGELPVELTGEAARFGVPVAFMPQGPRHAQSQLEPLLEAMGGVGAALA